ncbi:MAG: type II/IV secretion system ATPase subunit [Candidatus Aenigmarchaeota archaeon]|nr:type II/IV secretion system ATPase subunit [Candidatus Aenigmarchaeota archaeon]
MKKLKKISIKKIKEVKVFPKFKIPVLAFSKKIKHEKIDFKIEKERKIIEFPEGKEIDFTYNIIPSFVKVHIYYDKKIKQNIYEIIEPKLNEQEKEIYNRIVEILLETIDIELSAIRNTEKLIPYIEENVQKIIEKFDIKINKEQIGKILYYIWRNFVGLNELEPLIQDIYIEDISCDGTNIPIYVTHRKYGSLKTNIKFESQKNLEEFIMKLAERCGRYISYAQPLLDGTLPDGSRVQATLASDVTTRGPSFTIRKFREIPYSPTEIIELGTSSSEILAYLWLAIENGASILIAGGTGTGKTSLLNALSLFIKPESKIISIEDTRELQLPHENWIASVTRTSFAGEYGEVTLFDLLKESFRQSPDYVIVGEVRGKEAYVLFQGMASGIPAMGTMHAGRVEDVIYRLQTPPIEISPSLLETLDIIVLLTHAHEIGPSARRIREVVEIEAVDPISNKAKTNVLFTWLASNDSFSKREYSWVLQKISQLKGISIEDLQKDLDMRTKILNWAKKKNIKNYKDFANIISEFYHNKENLLKKIK